MESSTAVGIDLGGTNIKLVVTDGAGSILREMQRETADAAGEPPWPRTMDEMLQEVGSAFGKMSVGIAAPGLASRDARCISFMPGRLHGLEGLDWTRRLNTEQPVRVLNDAHAALLGERWKGAAAGCQNVILLTLGTGVGGAAMVDGKLLRGAIGRAGHFGHVSLNPDGPPDICGAPGSLEDSIGECTLAKRSDGMFSSTRELVDAHREGNEKASCVWLRSVKTLAAAIASLINILDPELVVLGGGISKAGDALFAPLEECLATMEWRPGGHRARIVPAALGPVAGALGAAFYGMNGQMS